MAKQRKAPPVADWRHLVSAGALVTGVFGTLLLGAVLQADPDTPELADRRSMARTAADGPVPAAPLGVDPVPAGLGETGQDTQPTLSPRVARPITGDADLVDRAAADERRLQASGHGYTLQFAVNCEPKKDFYLLTMLYQDRACFRLCWGFYDNEQQARSARDVPERLSSMTPTPKVISIAEALP
jgi:hypothetical protein